MSSPSIAFNRNYFSLAVAMFVAEVVIALFVKDNFVRPYLGDVLVVILMYCFLKSFVRLPAFPAAIFVLLVSFAIEFLQYVHIVEKLGWGHSRFARTVIGTSFAWGDLLAYTIGGAVVMIAEVAIKKSSRQGPSDF